jgi:hypothetical protein
MPAFQCCVIAQRLVLAPFIFPQPRAVNTAASGDGAVSRNGQTGNGTEYMSDARLLQARRPFLLVVESQPELLLQVTNRF